jgi:hypothetical protein
MWDGRAWLQYPASDYDALERFLLDDGRVKSSHDRLHAMSSKQRKNKTCRLASSKTFLRPF